MEKTILLIFTIFSILIISYKFGKHYSKQLQRFVFNMDYSWNKYIDKPRVFLFALMLIYLYFILNIELQNRYLYWIIFFLKILSLLAAIWFSRKIWHESFALIFIPKIISKFETNKNNFNLKYSDAQYDLLYYGLKREELIDYDKTTLKIFKQVLKEDFNSHENKIFSKLTAVDFRIFYNLFIKNSGTELTVFSQTSNKIIWSEKNILYNYGSLTSNNNEITKKSDILNKLAKEIHSIKY